MSRPAPHICPWCEPAQSFRHPDALAVHMRTQHPKLPPRMGTPITRAASTDAQRAELRALAASEPDKYEALFLVSFLELAAERLIRANVVHASDSEGVRLLVRQSFDTIARDHLRGFLTELRQRQGGV